MSTGLARYAGMVRAVLFALIAASLLALATCASGGSQAAPEEGSEKAAPAVKAEAAEKARTLPAPAHIPVAARALLSQRMQRHGVAMSDMMWAVMFLDYESTEDIAREIASEPRLARPLSRDASELNALLPSEFFDLQDALARAAENLATVAPERDPEQLSAAVAKLTDTCIRCHSAYLREPEPK